MAWLFAVSLFLSAALLFAIQPMMGKVALPKFGGGPAVWNTCMVFYQAMLLAGYGYAHFAPARLGPERQAWLHLVLLALPLLLVPLGWLVWPFAAAPLGLAESWAPPAVDFPAPFVLLVLAATIGLPFFVLTTTAPLLQKWYAATGQAGGRDPYWLYAASNLGSLIALLSYPFVIERQLSLPAQGWIWLGGYALAAGLIGVCLVVSWRAAQANQGQEPPEDSGGSESDPPVADTDPARPADEPESVPADAEPTGEAPTALQRCFWVARAFVPSSLMLGLTTHFTTEIAPVPLLWVLPLAVYLVSFIIAFGRVPVFVQRAFAFLMPAAVLFLAYLLLVDVQRPTTTALALHLGVLFVVATALHGAIAERRPAARYLTEFYLWIALGGVLGGSFNAWAAPLLFPGPAEYPLTLVLAALVLPPVVDDEPVAWRVVPDCALLAIIGVMGAMLLARFAGGENPLASWLRPRGLGLGLAGLLYVLVGIVPVVLARRDRLRLAADWLLPLAIFLFALALQMVDDSDLPKAVLLPLATVFGVLGAQAAIDLIQRRFWRLFYLVWPGLLAARLGELLLLAGVDVTANQRLYLYALPLLLAATALDRPVRFGLGLAALLLAGVLVAEIDSQAGRLHRERSFFGVCKVYAQDTENGVLHKLIHGTILHGIQALRDDLKSEAITYYHIAGPLGDVMLDRQRRKDRRPIGVVGLGTGSVATYAGAGQEAAFYEIDPAVARIARDPALFTYLDDAEARGASVRVVLGDGRVMLGREPDGRFGLIVVDAFSSDAIPGHLLTREAVQTYFRKLGPSGILAVHISNRYLDLTPVLGNLASDAGLAVYERFDTSDGVLKYASDWIVLARRPEELAGVVAKPGWAAVPPDPTRRLWTDDFSNLLDVYRWKD